MDLQIRPVRKYLTYQLLVVTHNAICTLFTGLTEQPKQTNKTVSQTKNYSIISIAIIYTISRQAL